MMATEENKGPSPVKETSAADELDVESLVKIEHQDTQENMMEILKKR